MAQINVTIQVPRGAEATVSTGLRWGGGAWLNPTGDYGTRLEFRDYEAMRTWFYETMTAMAKAEADDRVAKAEADARAAASA